MDYNLILTIWLILSVVLGISAVKHNIGGFSHFITSILLSPIIGLVIYMISLRRDKKMNEWVADLENARNAVAIEDYESALNNYRIARHGLEQIRPTGKYKPIIQQNLADVQSKIRILEKWIV